MTCQVTSSTHGAKTRTNVTFKAGRHYLRHNTMDKVTKINSFWIYIYLKDAGNFSWEIIWFLDN